jgi:outer membrane receptor protein involved in Fe transport
MVNETWQVEGGLRYYSQSQADFYRREITQRPIPTISSSDQRLAGFGALEPSLKVIAKVGDHVSVDLSFSRYMQRGTWKLGGRPPGTEGEYEPLRARLINAGLVYRF